MKSVVSVGVAMVLVACASADRFAERGEELASRDCDGASAVCHRTDEGPYVRIAVGRPACLRGHAGHPEDFADTTGDCSCVGNGQGCQAAADCCSGACVGGMCADLCPGGDCKLACGEECEVVLTGDQTLPRAITLGAGANVTRIDCGGHRLTPAAATGDTALLLEGTRGTTIEDCVIEGFEFGIVVLAAKEPAGSNTIRANVVTARTTAVYLAGADGTRIEDNRLTYTKLRGRGIVVANDSDGTEIRGNTVTSTDQDLTNAQFPGPGSPLVAPGSYDNGVHVVGTGLRTVLNVVIDGELTQVYTDAPGHTIADLDSFLPNDTQIIDNTFNEAGHNHGSTCALRPDLVCASNSVCLAAGAGNCLVRTLTANPGAIQLNFGAQATVVRGNTVNGWTVGIGSGGVGSSTALRGGKHGTCTGSSTRVCNDDSDCTLAGFPNVGLCGGAADSVINGNSQLSLIEDNTVIEAVLAGLNFGQTRYASAFRNVILGRGITARGVAFRNEGVATPYAATLERNVVDGAINAVGLDTGNNVTSFGVKLTGNDFTRYTNEVITVTSYALPSELSVAGRGNYWGRDCAAGAFDPTLVRRDDTQVNPYPVDSHPYGVPVAALADAERPLTCSGN